MAQFLSPGCPSRKGEMFGALEVVPVAPNDSVSSTRVARIFNLRFILLSLPNMVPFHKKIIPENDYCNRTTGKGADLALKFRIHQ